MVNLSSQTRQQQKQGRKIGMANKHRLSHVFQTFRHEIKHQTNITSLKCLFILMHDLPYCILAPMPSMNGHVNECSWY